MLNVAKSKLPVSNSKLNVAEGKLIVHTSMVIVVKHKLAKYKLNEKALPNNYTQ